MRQIHFNLICLSGLLAVFIPACLVYGWKIGVGIGFGAFLLLICCFGVALGVRKVIPKHKKLKARR